MENWILAKKIDGEVVKVRQETRFSGVFIDESGNKYNVCDLDFTDSVVMPNMPDFTPDKNLVELKDMMKSFDVKAQDDHRAAINEKEYWRGLRFDIFKCIMEHSGQYTSEDDVGFATEMTQRVFDELYDQHKAFLNGAQ